MQLTFPVSTILHHPLKRGSVEVRAAPAVVDVFVKDDESMIFCVLAENGPLCFDGNTVAVIAVVLTESHIERGIVWLFHDFPPFFETTHAYDTTALIIS